MSSDNDLDMVPVPEANGANADDVLLNVELPLAELLMQAGYYLQEQVECDGIDTIAGEVEVDVGDGEQTEEKMHDVEEREHESPVKFVFYICSWLINRILRSSTNGKNFPPQPLCWFIRTST